MTLRTWLLPLAATALALGASGCFVTVDDGDPAYTYPLAYEWCVDDRDCDVEDWCEYQTFTYEDPYDPRRDVTVSDGLCTHDCGSDYDCPEDWETGMQGACYDVGYGFLCYQRCFVDSDCPSGYACIDTVGGVTGDAICLPY